MRPVILSFPAASVNSICLVQTTAGAANLLLNGAAFYQNGCPIANAVAWFPGIQAPVTLTSTGNLSGSNITVTGFDAQWKAVAETRAGPNNNTVATTQEFMVVSSIASDRALGTNMSAGNGTTGHTSWVMLDRRTTSFEVGIAAVVTNTINYTVQHTLDNPSTVTTPTTFDDPILAGLAANASSTNRQPVIASRGVVSSSSAGGTVVFTFIQDGPT